MDAVTSKRQKKMSQRQEKKLAEDIEGRTVAGSGAGRTSGGGDVRKRSVLRAECKVTEQSSYTIKFTDLLKIQDQAIKGGLEHPVVQVRFSVPRGGTFEYAIEPGARFPLPYKGRKSIKVTLSDLQVRLLNEEAIGLEFDFGGVSFFWKIRLWTTFMKEWEQRADD